jgi:CarD family transcriptional regulator
MQIGEFIVYPAQGVGRVEAVESRRVSGSEVEFFLVSLLSTEDQILIPVARATACGVRKIVDPEAALRALDTFDRALPDWTGVSWIRRGRHYEEHLGRGELAEVAQVLRDLLHMKASGPLSFGQIQLLERASRMVVHEVALATGCTASEISREIAARTELTLEGGTGGEEQTVAARAG